MISALHLIWIIPLSMLLGMILLLCIACLVAGSISEEEEQEILRKIEEEKLKEEWVKENDN